MSKLTTWVSIPKDSDFTIYNLPYGIFSVKNKRPRVGVAIGEQILDLKQLAKTNLLAELKIPNKVFAQSSLNSFIALGKEKTTKLRKKVQDLLSDKKSPLKQYPKLFVKQSVAKMYLPVAIGDYTDFYSSMEHAINFGKMFRDPENALLPNWRHLPVAYHGRASSIVVSGTPIHRPKGQTFPKDARRPVFQASQLLDFELEMGFIIGKENQLGQAVSTQEAEEYIFGLVLLNDWSARDIQKWEYVPLGPFLGKNFATSISPWIVPLEALEPFRVYGPKQKPKVLPYLKYKGKQNYNIKLTVGITPKDGVETIVSKSNFRYMYWNILQQIAHHTVNGCNLRVGDLLASGTISGKHPKSYGSMIELSWAGTQDIKLKGGVTRKFLQNGDSLSLKAFAKKGDIRVGFGEVKAEII